MLIEADVIKFMHELRGDEHLQYGAMLVAEIRDDVLSIPELVAAWNDYEPVVHHEGLIFQVSQASFETEEIARADRARDWSFREVRRLLRYYAKPEDGARKEAADALLFVMHSYEAADRRNLFGETAYIRNFVTEMGGAGHVAQVGMIPGLAELLADLGAANERLDGLYMQRLHAVEELQALGKRVDVRKDADRALVYLLGAINTVYAYNELWAKSAVVRETLERVGLMANGLHDKLRLIMAQRKGKRRKKDEKGKDGENPAQPEDEKGKGAENPAQPEDKKG